jgi:hypothetical protein
MNNQAHLQSILAALEKRFGADVVYDYFSAFYDVVVLGHTSHPDDNPHMPNEQPCHVLYHTGAVAAERLLSQLRRASPEPTA